MHVHTHHHDHHGHGHDHHGHSHGPVALDHVNTAFLVGIALNLLFVVVEAVYGFVIHSLSLLSDAGHNLADVAGLALSLFAFRMLKVKSNPTYTYGYKKTTVIVALFNAVVLLVSVGAIAFEAIEKLIHPQPLPGKIISIVAGIGIVINATTALMFLRDREKDLNVKGAYLHLMGDAAVSAALVVGGIVIAYTGWYWLDPALSLLVAAVIVISTWSLLRDSLRLSLDAVPQGIELREVQHAVESVPGVKEFHHIHIWALSTLENALTGHLVLDGSLPPPEQEKIKHEVRHRLQHLQINHATLETEAVSCEKSL